MVVIMGMGEEVIDGFDDFNTCPLRTIALVNHPLSHPGRGDFIRVLGMEEEFDLRRRREHMVVGDGGGGISSSNSSSS